MKLARLHTATPIQLLNETSAFEKALSGNAAVKAMLQPSKLSHWWKTYRKVKQQWPPPDGGGPYGGGGHYDAYLKGDPEKEKFFGGPSLGPM
jgi:hypothetical protein